MLLSKYLHLSKSIWKGPSGSFFNVVFLNGFMTVFLKSGFDLVEIYRLPFVDFSQTVPLKN